MKFGPVLFINIRFIALDITKHIRNYCKLRQMIEMVAVKLPEIMSGSITSENILSIRVLEWLVMLVGCKIKGINELEAR